LWIIWLKIVRSFTDNLGKNWQLIIILFRGYRRRLTIHQKCVSKPILAWAQVPQRVIKLNFHNFLIVRLWFKLNVACCHRTNYVFAFGFHPITKVVPILIGGDRKINWFKCSVSQLQERILKLILPRHSFTYFIQNLY
jgi:hypothetical protein